MVSRRHSLSILLSITSLLLFTRTDSLLSPSSLVFSPSQGVDNPAFRPPIDKQRSLSSPQAQTLNVPPSSFLALSTPLQHFYALSASYHHTQHYPISSIHASPMFQAYITIISISLCNCIPTDLTKPVKTPIPHALGNHSLLGQSAGRRGG